MTKCPSQSQLTTFQKAKTHKKYKHNTFESECLWKAKEFSRRSLDSKIYLSLQYSYSLTIGNGLYPTSIKL